jgi:hypothetical protein
MAIITAQKFSGTIKALRKLDDAAREMVSGIVSYALFQYHAHNNKTPYLTITSTHEEKSAHLNAGLPAWLTSALKAHVKLGTRNVSRHSESVCEHMGDTLAAIIFASEEERKAQRKAARVEKAAATPKADAQPKAAPAPEATVIEGECELVTIESASVLVVKGEAIELSAAEADALRDTLMALRAQMMATPLRLAA